MPAASRDGGSPDRWDPFICIVIALATGANALLPDAWRPLSKVVFLDVAFCGVWSLIFLVVVLSIFFDFMEIWGDIGWGFVGMAVAFAMQAVMLLTLHGTVSLDNVGRLMLSDLKLADATRLTQVALVAVLFVPAVDFCVFMHIRRRTAQELGDPAWHFTRILFALMAGFATVLGGEFLRMLSSRGTVAIVASVALVVSAVWAWWPWRPWRHKAASRP